MLQKVCKKVDEFSHPRKVFGVFLIMWLVINLIQAIFTELAHDEAYYWLFSKKLDWGYFDHPPMIALLVKIGSSVFQGELGVRLLPILLGVATLWIIFLLAEDKLSKVSTFIILISSIVIFKSHIGGFLAIPDLPVIFFAALFFFLYKKYLVSDNLYLAFGLGLVAAAMLYSKYHAILVLGFTLLSNLSLFRRRTFYIIPVVAIIAMIPHLLWQIENNFPTFEYHLVSRSSKYAIVHNLNYLVSQLLVAGPLIGVFVFYHAVKSKANGDIFQTAMKFNFYGFFIFFFLMSFRGHGEAHWTAIGFISAVLLSVNEISKNQKSLRWVQGFFIPTLIIFLFIRVSLVFDILPKQFNVGREFHNWDTWAQEIKKVADGRKVVFYNTFQRPSKYSFYTGGDFSHTYNTVWYRQNQFDLWNYHDSIQGEDIMLLRIGRAKDSVYTNAESDSYRFIDDFISYENIPVLTPEETVYCSPQDTIILRVDIINLYNDTLNLNKIDDKSPRFYAMKYDGKHWRDSQALSFIDTSIAPFDTITQGVALRALKVEGKQQYYISIVNNGLRPGFNGKPINVQVGEK
jgi:hypothetical protein